MTRRVFCIGLALWAAVPGLRGASPADLDREGGFRGAKLGAPLKDFQGLEKQFLYKGVTAYARKGDELRIGPIPVESISYEFFKDHLSEISIWVTSAPSIPLVVAEFTRLYGEPKRNEEPKYVLWAGEKILLLGRYTDEGTLHVRFMDRKLLAEVTEARKNRDYITEEN